VVFIGGKIKEGYSIVSGVVKNDIKKHIDSLVKQGKFTSRCQAIGFLITKFHKELPRR